MIKLICSVLLSIVFSLTVAGCDVLGGGDDETQSVDAPEESTTVADALPDPGSSSSCSEVNFPLITDNSTGEPAEEEEEPPIDGTEEVIHPINAALAKAVKSLSSQGFGYITDIRLRKDGVTVIGCNNVVVIDSSSTTSNTSGDTNS